MKTRMQLLGKKAVLDMYIMGGWDSLKNLKDTPENRKELQYVLDTANRRRDRLKTRSTQEPGFYSRAYENTKKDYVGQKRGMFEPSDDWNKMKSEALRAIVFLDDETSTVGGSRENTRDTKHRVFKKGFRGQTIGEERARWNAITDIIKKNPWLIAKAGDLGGWITSDQLQQWAQEYTERAEDDPRGFKEYLRDKIAEYLGIDPEDIEI